MGVLRIMVGKKKEPCDSLSRKTTIHCSRRIKPENDNSLLQEDDSGRKTTSRVSRSIKAVKVDWFDGSTETYNFMGVP
jgi:hypothetical protein